MEGKPAAAGRSRGWPYVVTGVAFAGICAWISYNDGLFVARLAGNHDALAYFYPLLPDGLIVLCLLALTEAARAGASRSRWAVGGLLLGIALTLAMNTYAGIEHSVLDAVLDGMVPVVFFIAAEVVLWHVRHARPPVPAQVPSIRHLKGTLKVGQPVAERVQAYLAGRLEGPPAGFIPDSPLTPAGAHLNGNGAHG